MRTARLTPEASAMKTITAFIGAMWLSTPVAFKIMLLAMAFDAVSAFFNPKISFKRRISTLGLSLLLALMVQIGWFFASHNTGINLGFDVAVGVCAFYSLGSAVDTVVNFAEAGVSIPPVLLGLLVKAQGLTGKEREQLDAVAKAAGQQ